MLKVLRRKLHSARIRWHRAHGLGPQWFGGEYQAIFERKHLLNALLRGAGIATVTDLAVIGREHSQVLSGNDCEPAESMQTLLSRDYLAGLPQDRYFLKPVSGIHGLGAGCLEKGRDGLQFNGSAVTVPDLLLRVEAAPQGLLLQRWQPQHAALAAFNASTLNTLRILTVQNADGVPRAFHAVLRLGRADAWLDNFHAGGIALFVDLEHGRTRGQAVPLDRAEEYSRHPDSGIELDDQAVEGFADACTTVARAHALFPDVPTIGWDVAIAPNGPKVVEANLDWDAEIHAFVDPEFRSKLVHHLRESGRGRNRV